MSRIYLYGIIEGENGAVFSSTGIDGSGPVYTVGHQRLGCVVSDYSGEGFVTMSKEKLIRSLLTHQQVVEQVMQDHTVLPVKFGTFLSGSQEVCGLLSQGQRDFASALAAIRDRVEIEIAATWDTSQVLQEISGEQDVVRAREAITSKGQPTLEDLIKLGQLVKARMDKRREGYRERMLGLLTPLSVDVSPNTLVSDELVVNVAFLVNRARQQEFDAAVQQLNQLFQNEIDFRVIGPLPPYSFSTVEISLVNRDQLDAARRTLGLPDGISEAEVRRAYRRLAAQQQRSLGSGDKVAKAEFARSREASQLLLGYLQKGEWRDFLITIKRSEAEDLPHAPSATVRG